jgi:LPS export ABC transporter protein LptC
MFRTIFFILLGLLSLTACENSIDVINSTSSALQNQLPIESSKNIQVLYSDSAVVRAKLIAPQADHFATKKPYYEMPKGMQITFFNKNKKEETKLTANYGIGYDTGSGMEKMEAKGNVIVINEKGDKLNTEHLTWNALTRKIYTDEFVKITTKDQVIWGDGMEANENFTRYEIKNVKGQIDIEDEDKPKN